MRRDVQRFQFSSGTIPCDKLEHLSQLKSAFACCIFSFTGGAIVGAPTLDIYNFPPSAFPLGKYRHEIFI